MWTTASTKSILSLKLALIVLGLLIVVLPLACTIPESPSRCHPFDNDFANYDTLMVPNILDPVNDSEVVNPPSIHWTFCPCATSYRIQINTTPDFSSEAFIIDEVLSAKQVGPSPSFVLNEFDNNGNHIVAKLPEYRDYWVRVRMINEKEIEGEYSQYVYFKNIHPQLNYSRMGHTMLTINDVIYVLGGQDNEGNGIPVMEGYHRGIFKANPQISSWDNITINDSNLESYRRYVKDFAFFGAYSDATNQTITTIGGMSLSNSQLLRFSYTCTLTNTDAGIEAKWSSATLKEPFLKRLSVERIGDEIFYLGGVGILSDIDESSYYKLNNTVRKYPGNGQVSETPEPTRYAFASTVYNGKIYIAGGTNNQTFFNDVYQYDPYSESSQWVRVGFMEVPRSGFAMVAIEAEPHKKIYLIGGRNEENFPLDTAEELDMVSVIQNTTYNPNGPVLTRTESLSPMIYPRADHACTVYNEAGDNTPAIFCSGGTTDLSVHGVTDTVEIYDPLTDKWSR